MSLLPREERQECQRAVRWGGVSEKGSLAKERNSYTFLSNLVRTTLACFLLRAPHEVCNTHQKEKTDRVGEKLAKSPGQECFVANRLCWCRRKPHLPVEFSLLPGFFSCFLSQSPTSCPAPSTAPDSLDESWVSPRTWRFTPHSPSAIVQASSSPSSSFQESLLNSLTHSLTLSHPNPPPQLVQKRVSAVLQVWSRGSSRQQLR